MSFRDNRQQQPKLLGKKQGGQLANRENAKAGPAQLDCTIQKIDDHKATPRIRQWQSAQWRAAWAQLPGGQCGPRTIARIDQLTGQAVTNVMQSFKNTGIRLNLQEVQQLKQGADSRVSASRVTNVPAFLIEPLDDLYSQIAGMRNKTWNKLPGQAETPSPQGQRAVQSNAPVAINRQTGQRITLKNGQWVPLQ